MLIASAVNERTITSRSENLGTTTLLVVFQSSLTKIFEYYLHIPKIFRYFIEKCTSSQLLYLIDLNIKKQFAYTTFL